MTDWSALLGAVDSWPGAVVAVALVVGLLILPKLRDLLAAVADVRHEVKPNGGSSMKDALARLEASSKRQEAALASHLVDAAEDRARLRALEATMAEREGSS